MMAPFFLSEKVRKSLTLMYKFLTILLAMLRNEKYAGNALLQKRFVRDHLTKAQVSNHGELPKYYAEGTHEAIIDLDTFERVQDMMNAKSKHIAPRVGQGNRYAFSSMIRCSSCGKNYKRKVARGRAYWNCSTYLNYGKDVCSGKQIPEDILMVKAAEILGLSNFDEKTFKDQIAELLIPEPNRIIFTFKDGHSIESNWQDKSRSDSWSEEMKRTASIRTTRQRRGDR